MWQILSPFWVKKHFSPFLQEHHHHLHLYFWDWMLRSIASSIFLFHRIIFQLFKFIVNKCYIKKKTPTWWPLMESYNHSVVEMICNFFTSIIFSSSTWSFWYSIASNTVDLKKIIPPMSWHLFLRCLRHHKFPAENTAMHSNGHI